VACPVVAKHADRNEIVIYGGAVHLSKEAIPAGERAAHFGRVAMPTSTGWQKILEGTYVKSISQEHGIIKTEKSIFSHIHLGEVVMIIPVHSCLAVNLLKNESLIL
jgi:D-serine deaminase-like pyridoxal phosphate-dependent protein